MSTFSEAEMQNVTRQVMDLLDSWDFTNTQVIQVLDMPEGTPTRMASKFRDDVPLPDDPKVLKRVQYLLHIKDALRTTYPRNPRMSERWMKQVCKQFRGKTPIQVIEERGESGLIHVLSHLDCTFAWDRSGSSGIKPA